MSYVFTTELLSATAPAIGTPPPLNTALSSTWASGIDVAVHVLSAGAVGLAFTPVTLTTQTSALSIATVGTNRFSIAAGYHGQTFAIVSPIHPTTFFVFNSGSTAQTISDVSRQLVYPTKRRKWLMGY